MRLGGKLANLNDSDHQCDVLDGLYINSNLNWLDTSYLVSCACNICVPVSYVGFFVAFYQFLSVSAGDASFVSAGGGRILWCCALAVNEALHVDSEVLPKSGLIVYVIVWGWHAIVSFFPLLLLYPRQLMSDCLQFHMWNCCGESCSSCPCIIAGRHSPPCLLIYSSWGLLNLWQLFNQSIVNQSNNYS